VKITVGSAKLRFPRLTGRGNRVLAGARAEMARYLILARWTRDPGHYWVVEQREGRCTIRVGFAKQRPGTRSLVLAVRKTASIGIRTLGGKGDRTRSAPHLESYLGQARCKARRFFPGGGATEVKCRTGGTDSGSTETGLVAASPIDFALSDLCWKSATVFHPSPERLPLTLGSAKRLKISF